MGLALLDSSALVAYVQDGDTLHASATEVIESTVRGGTGLVVSSVTWTEVLHGALIGRVPEGAVVEFVDDFGIDALPVDGYVAERAADLQMAYRHTRKRAPWPRLRTPDALILATAETYDDVTTVIAGDRQWANVPGLSVEVLTLRERG